MPLEKFDILDRLHAELGFSKKQSVAITEPILELIKSSPESGDDARVSGFGISCVTNDKGRKGRNPAAGRNAILSGRRGVTFKRSGKLREKVNGKQ